MTEIIKAFQTKPSLERIFKDNDSDAFYPDKNRAAKNFEGGFKPITREQALNPGKKPTAKRGRKVTKPDEGNNKSEPTA